MLLQDFSGSLDEFVEENNNTILHLACEKQFDDRTLELRIICLLLKFCSVVSKNKSKHTPLHLACISVKTVPVINHLFETLPESCTLDKLIDQNGYTVLHCAVAAEEPSVDVVESILKHTTNTLLCKTLKHGLTPIHIACMNGSFQIVQTLVSKTTEVVYTINGNSYLHLACEGKSPEVVQFLLNDSQLDRSSLLVANIVGNTPLHVACFVGSATIIKTVAHHCPIQFLSLKNNILQNPFCCLLVQKRIGLVKELISDKTINDQWSSEDQPFLHSVIKNVPNEMALDLITFIVSGNFCDPLKCCKKGNTILHCFAQCFISKQSTSSLPLWRYLLKLSSITSNQQNEDGDTALHLLVQMNSRHFGYSYQMLMVYLDEAIPIDSNLVNLRNADGKTAIQFASPQVTRLLIKYGANPEDVSALYSDVLAMYKRKHPLEPSIKVFFLGNSKAGKSTLVQTIMSLDSPNSERKDFVTTSTAGIKTTKYTSKVFGHVTLHDFAGQPEYESGNATLLNTGVSINYPPIFLVVVNVSQENSVKQIQNWFSYIRDNTPIQLAPHVIIIGSHSDCISVSDHQRVENHINSSIKNMKSCKLHLANLILIDCRDVRSEQIEMLSQVLADSSKQLRRSLELDSRCHVLIAYLTKWYKHISEVAFKKIQDKISTASNSDANVILPVARHALLELLKTLQSGGHITLLNPDNIDRCWIVLDDALLYEKVNGTLFAPSDQTFNIPRMPTNVGVITSDMLKSVFKDKNIDLITAYIIHSELGQKIEDSESVRLIQSACSSQDTIRESQVDSGTSLEVTSQDGWSVVPSGCTDLTTNKYLFLPGLVKSEQPSDVWGDDSNSSYSFCWYMKCKVEEFLSQRFLQVLLLRLTFNFVSKKSSSKQLFRKCNIWKNGVHWSTKQGVEVLVEVIEQNSAVVLLMRFTKGHEIEGVEFRSKLITKILHTKNEFCPNTEVFEILFPQTFNYPINTQAANIPICQVAQAITNGDPCVVDSKSKPHELSKLLFYEPFVCSLECLWHEENQKNKVSTELLTKVSRLLTDNKEMAARGVELMARIDSSTSLTYEALRRLIGRFSIFCDRNPFSIASIEEPSPEMYEESLFKIKKTSPVCSQQTEQVQHQLEDKTLQVERFPDMSPHSQIAVDAISQITQMDPTVQIDSEMLPTRPIITLIPSCSEPQRVTVRDLQEEYGIDEEQLEKTVDKSDINNISKFFGEVDIFLPGLQLLPAQEADVRSVAHSNGNELAVNKALDFWRNTYCAKCRTLIEIILKVPQASVARDICQYLKQK